MTIQGLKAPSKSSAPGQYLGYGLQDVRLCHHLHKAAVGTVVSLEYVEDTAVHGADKLLLEQSKSALSGNPIADGSQELWKSFATWASLCSSGEIDPVSTRFRLYVCPDKKGKLVNRIHAAGDDIEANAVLATITKKVKLGEELVGPNPKITEFLNAGPDICRKIIVNFELHAETDPLEPIREVLRFSVLEDSLEDFCAYAIGMAKNQVAELIRAGSRPTIDALTFRKQLQSFIRKHGALGLLVPTTEQPVTTVVDTLIDAAPVFVQQLVKVNMTKDQLVGAVSDFLRSEADRTLWAADGKIVEESLEELNNTLEAHFKITRDEVEDMHAQHDDETRGRQIYRQCIKRQEPLEGRAVPGYFISGTFNLLANTARVGWHPKYAEFFAANS